MRRIRYCVFESNSSNSHSCIIMTEKENSLWSSGDYFYYEGDWELDDLPNPPLKGKLYTRDEAFNYCKQGKYFDADNADASSDASLAYEGFTSYNFFMDDEYMEFDDHIYTTPGGETIIVNCKYGHDG